MQAMLHLLKLHTRPDRPHWLEEIDTFLGDASDCYSPSMRQRIDMQSLHARVIRRFGLGQPSLKLPASCPWRLDELLADPPDLASLLTRIDPAPTP